MESSNPLSLGLLVVVVVLLLLVLCLLLACHCLGPRAASWMRMRSSKEEKIGLSKHKHKLFHPNGYMASVSERASGDHSLFCIHQSTSITTQSQTISTINQSQIQSGSEFLLSTSGSFKRFDTIDKDDHNRSQQQLQQQQQLQLQQLQQQQHLQLHLQQQSHADPATTTTTTTPLWNLPQADVSIPPQPLRPAPAPNSAGPNSKTVTFSFSQINELSSPSTEHRPAEPPRASCLRAGSAQQLPQPLEAPPPPRLTTSASVTLSATAIPRPIAKRQVSLQQGINRSTEMQAPVQQAAEQQAQHVAERRPPALKRRNSSTNPFLCESTEQMPQPQPEAAPAPAAAPAAAASPQHNGNPFLHQSPNQSLSSRLLKLHNANNPFTGLTQRVKGPHMLQKTISEDYLFRKLGMVNGQLPNGHGGSNSNSNSNGNGNSTWCFGRSLLRQESSISLGLGRRNSSQTSLDGSLEGINLEHAISCDSVNSDASSLCLDQLDQPYTQITGYLCVGLQFEK